MTPPALSHRVPVYDNWWLTARCLRALDALRNRCAFEFETIVVDNASSDETPHAIADFPWVRYVRHEENRNFAGACNAGMRAAQAPVTLLLNNDAYPLGDALTPMLAAFERDDVAIAGGALFFEDGVTQAAGLVLLPNAHWHYYCRNLPASLDAVAAISRRARGLGRRDGGAHAVVLRRPADSTSRSSTVSKTSISACARASRAERSPTSRTRVSRTTRPLRRGDSSARPRTSCASTRAGRRASRRFRARNAARSARSRCGARAAAIPCSTRRSSIWKRHCERSAIPSCAARSRRGAGSTGVFAVQRASRGSRSWKSRPALR